LVLLVEELTRRWDNIVTVQDAAQAVFGSGSLGNDPSSMGDEGAEFPDFCGWHPDFGDEVGGQEFGQRQGVALIGFDRGGDKFDLVGVGDDHAGHPWFK
jgi:hypothetical protein